MIARDLVDHLGKCRYIKDASIEICDWSNSYWDEIMSDFVVSTVLADVQAQ